MPTVFSPPFSQEEIDYMKNRLMLDYPRALNKAHSGGEETFRKTDKIASSVIHKLQSCHDTDSKQDSQAS